MLEAEVAQGTEPVAIIEAPVKSAASGAHPELNLSPGSASATKRWEVTTALAELDALLDTLALQRGQLADAWIAETRSVADVEAQLRTVDAAISHRSIALRDFLQRNPDLSSASSASSAQLGSTAAVLASGSNGAWTVRREVEAIFDQSIRDAQAEIAQANRKPLNRRGKSQVAGYLDAYRAALGQLERARQTLQANLEQAKSARSHAVAEARVVAQAVVDEVKRVARGAQTRLPPSMRPWNDAIWQSGWTEAPIVVGSSELFAGVLRPQADQRLGDNSGFGTAETLPLVISANSNVHIVHSPAEREIGQSLARSLLLRSLTASPAGRARFTIFDPVGLGQSVAGLLDLAEYDASLIGGKVWSASDDLRARLDEHTSHIELVIQKYLRSTFATIDEFNVEADEVAEPYRFFVAFDFPNGFNEESSLELMRIIENGPRCGVRTILVSSTDLEVPYGVNVEAIAAAVPRLVLGQPVVHESRGCSMEMAFDADADFLAREPLVRQIVEVVGRQSATQADPVVSFEKMFRLFAEASRKSIRPELPEAAGSIDLDRSGTWWPALTTEGIVAPIGMKGARDVSVLTFDSGNHAGALLVGRPGSGKSTLLHSFIAAATTIYGPDELELYLVDFKEGVEFEVYASESLPHARCVAIETDREFGLSVLQSLESELKRRGELLRRSGGQYSGLAGMRKQTGEVLPRILLVFDEFHVLFTRNDKVGLAAADLLEQLIRQGRGFGMHVLLGSQSLAGLDALGSHVPQLLPVRILLPAAEADARRVLGDGNEAGQYLTTHGDGILNPAAGAVEANERFKGALLDEGARLQHVARARQKADEQGFTRRPIVFEGNASTPIESILPSQFSEELMATGRAPLRIRVGTPMAIHGTADIDLRREAGSNVLFVARDGHSEETPTVLGAAGGLPPSLLVMAAASLICSPHAQIDLVDFTPIDDGIDSVLGPLLGRVGLTVHRRRGFAALIGEVLARVHSRIEEDDSDGPPRVLLLYGLHRARDLDASGMGLDSDPALADALEEILREGPEVGVHTWAWSETVGALSRRLSSSAIREFSWRVAGRQSPDDSQLLLGSEAAADLRELQVLVSNDDRGIMKRCTSYSLPTDGWLNELLHAIGQGRTG